MRTAAYKIALAFLAVAPLASIARDLDLFEKTCADIGFQKGTPAYGECVLELDRRANSASKPKSKPTVVTRSAARSDDVTADSAQRLQAGKETPVVRGDGSPDDLTCSGYGYRAGTDAYADCRMKLQAARLENERRERDFAVRKMQYEQQVAAIQEEERRQAQARMGECYMRSGAAQQQPEASLLGMLVNVSACESGASGPVVVAPPPPQQPTWVHCSFWGNTMTCI